MRTIYSIASAVAAVSIALSALVLAPPANAGPVQARELTTDEHSSIMTIPYKPTFVRVEVDTYGLTVFAIPQCDLANKCLARIRIPEFGIDKSQVSTNNGYKIAWPSNWAEGATHEGGTVESVACDLINCWTNSGRRASLGSITRPYATDPLTITHTGKDDAGRTMILTGKATKNASIRLAGGGEIARSGSNGYWSAVIRGLSLGYNQRTVQQFVADKYVDERTASVTIVDPVRPGQIVGEAGTADLARGTESDVSVTYQAKSAFSSPTGTLTLTAPTGTTFAPGQDQQPGEYEQGGTWTAFGGNSIIGGERSADGTQYRYQLANRDWGVAKDQRFRFTMRVVTPADVAPTTGELTGALQGSFTNATFDTTARTTTTVVDRALGAEVRDADVLAGTATLVGTAPARADSVEVTWQRDGQTVTRRAPATDGAWTLRLDGLALGETSVRLVATDGGAAVGDPVTVAVRLVAAELTAEARFDDDVAKPVTVTGRGQPGASIRFDGAWTAVPAVTVPSSGDWSVTIPAPGAGGTHPLTVVQTVRQQQAGSVPLRVDYGQGIEIRSPGDGFGIEPIWNTVRVSGVAAPGAQVRLGEGGDDDAYGTVTADASGRWAITTTPLEIREHVLVATALSKGANTTTDSVRITG